MWLKVIDCVWLLSASTPPQTSSSRGSKVMWTCSLLSGVWVTCTQEGGAVIHHHALTQTHWLRAAELRIPAAPTWDELQCTCQCTHSNQLRTLTLCLCIVNNGDYSVSNIDPGGEMPSVLHFCKRCHLIAHAILNQLFQQKGKMWLLFQTLLILSLCVSPCSQLSRNKANPPFSAAASA